MRLNILYENKLVDQFIKELKSTHMKSTRRILHYIKDTIIYDLLYSFSNEFRHVDYSDSDWNRAIKDQKSITSLRRHCFHLLLEEEIHCDIIYIWSRIYSGNIIYMTYYIVREALE